MRKGEEGPSPGKGPALALLEIFEEKLGFFVPHVLVIRLFDPSPSLTRSLGLICPRATHLTAPVTPRDPTEEQTPVPGIFGLCPEPNGQRLLDSEMWAEMELNRIRSRA
jgi:hypothetical protein